MTRKYFMINLHESMGPGWDQTHDPLIDLIFTSKSTIFQVCRDGSYWAEAVLSKD